MEVEDEEDEMAEVIARWRGANTVWSVIGDATEEGWIADYEYARETDMLTSSEWYVIIRNSLPT